MRLTLPSVGREACCVSVVCAGVGWSSPVASWALVAVLTALLFPFPSSAPTLACLCLRLVEAAEEGRVECMYAISWSMLLLLCVVLLSSDGGWSALGPSVGLFCCFLGLLGLRI